MPWARGREASGNSTLCPAIMHRTIEDSDPCQRGSRNIVYERLIALYRARFENVHLREESLNLRLNKERGA